MTVPSRRFTREIVRGISLAALILGVTIAATLAARLGLWHGADWSDRAAMAIIGVSLMILGNAIPKTLTPLASTSCDPVTLQRLQRLAGWTWVAAILVNVAAG